MRISYYIHLIGYMKHTAHMQLKFFSNYKESAIFKTLLDNNIKIDEETIVTFTDSSWNDCIDTGRSTGVKLHHSTRWTG